MNIASFARDENSDRLLSLETQLDWLREIGFADVDCYWKWLELALMIGIKPKDREIEIVHGYNSAAWQ